MKIRKNTKLIFPGMIVMLLLIVQRDLQGQYRLAWVNLYGGIGCNAQALVVDNSENCYVTGNCGTVKYNSIGEEIWVVDEGGINLGYDKSGAIYVSGRYSTVKYDTEGTVIWTVDHEFSARAIAIDTDGNLYVTGEPHFSLKKYNAAGEECWYVTYNFTNWWNDVANAVYVDKAGNVYITGTSHGGLITEEDYATIKYNSEGERLWVARYNGPLNEEDYAMDVVVDKFGNVYVTGYTFDHTDMYWGYMGDWATIKYSSDGEQLWEILYDGQGHKDDRALEMTIHQDGYIYIGGSISPRSDLLPLYGVIKYDFLGARYWVHLAGSDNDKFGGIISDRSGLLYLTGESQPFMGTKNYLTEVFAPDGTQIWLDSYDSSPPTNDSPHDIGLDRFGNIFVTGTSERRYGTIKYTREHHHYRDEEGGTSISDESPEGRIYIPGTYALFQNYPNPFNPTTTISFDIPGKDKEMKQASLDIFDLHGRHVKTMIDSKIATGTHRVTWDGRNTSGQQVSSGIYLYTLRSGEYIHTRKMLLVE